MTRLFLLILVSVLTAPPAFAQLGGIPPGDFRVQGGPGTAPTVGQPGGPSLPAAPTMFPHLTGPKPPDEILRTLDKELGKSSVFPLGGGPFESSQDLGERSSLSQHSEGVLKR